MITIYWFANGVRVVQGPHNDGRSHIDAQCSGDFVKKEFECIEAALKELKPINRAVPILKYMQEMSE